MQNNTVNSRYCGNPQKGGEGGEGGGEKEDLVSVIAGVREKN